MLEGFADLKNNSMDFVRWTMGGLMSQYEVLVFCYIDTRAVLI